MSEISKLNQFFSIKKIDNITTNLQITDNSMLQAIVGEFNQNLKELENLTNTTIFFRGNSITVKGKQENIKVDKSKTPIWTLLKCDRKDIDPIVSVIQIGAQDLTVDKTRLKPAIIKTNPLIDETIKAITWFFVRVERQEVKAKNAPAINQLVKYDINITLLSGFPK